MDSCWKLCALAVCVSAHACARCLEINVPLLQVSGLECAVTKKMLLFAEYVCPNCVCKSQVKPLNVLGVTCKQMRARQLTQGFPLAVQQFCIPQTGLGERPGCEHGPVSQLAGLPRLSWQRVGLEFHL